MSECIPLETYLLTHYRPDREWIEGRLLERNIGLMPHSIAVMAFIGHFSSREQSLDITVLPSLRVRVAANRYRVADLCILRSDAPYENIPTVPPLLCIEILSPEDSMGEMLERVDDYLRMGVPAVWLVDPWRRRAFAVDSDGTIRPERKELTLAGTAICVPVPEIFAELDEMGFDGETS